METTTTGAVETLERATGWPFGRLLAVFGGVVVVAVAILAATATRDSEPQLIASATPGSPVTIREVNGSPTVWVSGASGDPRPAGRPTAALCTVTGARLTVADRDPITVGGTTLWMVGTLEGLDAGDTVSCEGAGVAGAYVVGL